jgi:hypothetical protein
VIRIHHAAIAALAFVASAAGAQEGETPAPDTYTLDEDGGATHKATGAKCPAAIGDLKMVQVLTFDRQEGETNLGVSCQYLSEMGFTAAISILAANEPGLVGAGTEASRWNNTLYTVLGSYPGALPANVEGLEGDERQKLRGALFTANAGGLPARIGVWQIQEGDWQYSAQARFVATVEGGWTLAEQTRAALLATKDSAK